MVWALDFDDFTGTFCGGSKYPLLTALNSALDYSSSTAQNRYPAQNILSVSLSLCLSVSFSHTHARTRTRTRTHSLIEEKFDRQNNGICPLPTVELT
jgi:hypothetical protein